VLSQNPFHHENNLGQGNRPRFNQPCHHPQMNNQGLVNLGCRYASAFATSIKPLFLEFALGGLIVGGAPLRGAFLAVGLAASKGTIDIASVGIAKIAQKDNATVPASLQAWLEAGMPSYDATKFAHILSGYLSNPVSPIPIRFKPKKGLKFDNKKAKSSLVWLITLDIPSFSFMFLANS
jgi:hypothetical protein